MTTMSGQEDAAPHRSRQGRTRTVLVSGGGIAGLTAAYWLQRAGLRVIVVESAPALRRGGQAIDVRGPALQVLHRMGIGEAVAAARTRMRGMSVVDPDSGREIFSSTTATLTGGPMGTGDVEILRDDLVELLAGAVTGSGGAVELRYGERVAAVRDREDGVRVTLSGGEELDVELLIGADGLHSAVRRMVFPSSAVERHDLGTHLSVFTMPNEFALREWQVFAARGSTMCGVYTARGDSEVRVNMGYRRPCTYDFDDIPAQRAAVAGAFAGFGWWTERMLAGMAEADDFYLAPMVQIRMPAWSRGRVVLVGDAAWCTTPLSGQGTSLAIVGAHVLVGELAQRACAQAGDVGDALAHYEALMRPFVTANQELALVNEQRSRAMFGLDQDPVEESVDAAGTSPDPDSGITEHWVATAASAIELPEYSFARGR